MSNGEETECEKIIILTIGILLLVPVLVIANYNPFTSGYIEGHLTNITIIPATEETPQIVSARIETYEGLFYQLEIDERG